MILVAGILVLLVILATTFITRTQGGRATARAIGTSQTKSGQAEVIKDQIAAEITAALFPRPVLLTPDEESLVLGSDDQNPPDLFDARDANRPRIAPLPGAVRYGKDRDIFTVDPATGQVTFGPDGRPDFPWNFAPYEVRPWTNWPDDLDALAGNDAAYIYGAGAPFGSRFVDFDGDGSFDLPIGEENPYGGPGFGDTRWLRDTEPMRWDAYPAGFGGSTGINDGPIQFKMWRHLSNLSRADNGWRVIGDMSDVMNTLVLDLNQPVEQWLTTVQPDLFQYFRPAGPTFDAAVYDGDPQAELDSGNPDLNVFSFRWNQWFFRDAFDPTGFSQGVIFDPSRIPANFYNLTNLDGDTAVAEVGERPGDEFLLGSARWDVMRRMTDADGDGFTDALWHLAPASADAAIRYAVGVSISDASARLNANVATQFEPGTGPDVTRAYATAGETPADLALVGQQSTVPSPFATTSVTVPIADSWNVGLLDNPLHHDTFLAWRYAELENDNLFFSFDNPSGGLSDLYPVRWDPNRWPDFVRSRGVDLEGAVNADTAFDEALERRVWWLLAGSRPFEPLDGLTPFDVSDEIELRLWEGRNAPWAFSRLERAFNRDYDGSQNLAGQILRADKRLAENSPYWNGAGNGIYPSIERTADLRRHLTVHNGARNELAPEWLRWRYRVELPTGSGQYWPALPLSFKERIETAEGADMDAPGDPFFSLRQVPLDESFLKDDLRQYYAERRLELLSYPAQFAYLSEQLPWTFRLALSDERGPFDVNEDADHYDDAFGVSNDDARERTLDVAGALATNLLSYRDADTELAIFPDDSPATAAGDDGDGPVRRPRLENEAGIADRWYVGLERQPFLLEAFVAHVHASQPPPAGNIDLDLYDQDGDGDADNYVDDTSPQTTIVVVQVANPFDTVIPAEEFARYRIRVAGQVFSLDTLFQSGSLQDLPPATEENPVSAIFWMIEDQAAGFPAGFLRQWFDFLDLDWDRIVNGGDASYPEGTALYRVPSGTWPTDRSAYDRAGNQAGDPVPSVPNVGDYEQEHVIELIRAVPTGGGLGANDVDLVVDRFDPRSDRSEYERGDRYFAEILANLPRPPRPAEQVLQRDLADPTLYTYYDGWLVGDDDTAVVWARVARPWAFDFNGTPGIQDDERAQRFVSSDQGVSRSVNRVDQAVVQDNGGIADYGDPSMLPTRRADAFLSTTPPDAPYGAANPPYDESTAWFTVPTPIMNDLYDDAEFATVQQRVAAPLRMVLRKPTFFDGRWNRRRPNEFFHEKGVYGTEDDGLVEPAEAGWNTQSSASFFRYLASSNSGGYGELTGLRVDDANLELDTQGLLRIENDLDGDDVPDFIATDAMRFAWQMLQKDADIQQVGEVLNLWQHAHAVTIADPEADVPVIDVVETFSEALRGAAAAIVPFDPDLTDAETFERDRNVRVLNDYLASLDQTPVNADPDLQDDAELAVIGDGADRRDARWGRLREGAILGGAPQLQVAGYRTHPMHPGHGEPRLPASARLLDALVCDGPGVNWDPTVTNIAEVAFGNAGAYTGRMTPGLVNVNTAPVEVMRSLPNWHRLVHRTAADSSPEIDPFYYLRSALPEAAVSYRDRLANVPGNVDILNGNGLPFGSFPFNSAGHSALFGMGWPGGPDYAHGRWGTFERDFLFDDPFANAANPVVAPQRRSRGDRGFAATGELMLLQKQGRGTLDPGGGTETLIFPDAYGRSFAGNAPFGDALPIDEQRGAWLSTDVVNPPEDASNLQPFLNRTGGDWYQGDAEEFNMLLSGASNLVTVRSDVFVVHLHIRAFRQDPETGVWDATDRENVVDDSRYVMMVDRSRVNRPSDQPRILFFEKVQGF